MTINKIIIFIYIIISLVLVEFFLYLFFNNFLDLRFRSNVFENISIKNDKLLGWDLYNGRPRPSETISVTNNQNDVCAYIFGDSFSHADEVLDNQAWGEVLSKKLDCPIYNYGVGGYGSDQALLKMKKILTPTINNTNQKKNVFFGVDQEMLRRNLSGSWIFYCCPTKKNSLRPYFISQDDNSLKLIKIPDILSLKNIKEHHKHDYYYPTYNLKFPYIFEAIKVLYIHISNTYSKKIIHPSHTVYTSFKAIKTQKLIMIEAAKFANEKGYNIIFVFFPQPEHAYNNQNYYSSFYKDIEKTFKKNKKVMNIDLFPQLSEKSNLLGKSFKADDGHFNAEGNKYIAEIIFNVLQK